MVEMGYLDKWIIDNQNDPSYIAADIALDLAINISTKMKELGLTRKKLAEKLNVSSAYITKLLSGNTNMTLNTMIKVADSLGYKLNVKLESKSKISFNQSNYVNVLYLKSNNCKIEHINPEEEYAKTA